MANHTIKGLLGLPVITLDAGRRVGSIQEILYDSEENRVTAVILSKPPVAGSAKAVTADHIRLFGLHVALIDSDQSIATLAEDPATRDSVKAGTDVIRTQVLTTEGRRLGEVADIALDQEGHILGYRLSRNLIRDAFRGKTFVPVSSLFAVGDDAILVKAEDTRSDAEEPALEALEEESEEIEAPAAEDGEEADEMLPTEAAPADAALPEDQECVRDDHGDQWLAPEADDAAD